MFRLLCLTVFLLMSVSLWAKPKAVTSSKKGKEKMVAKLLKRCEDGIAIACYDYGKILIGIHKKADKRKGNIYIRRACTLAYAPACQMRSTVADSKPMKENKTKADANGRPCNGEELSRTAKLSADGRSVAEVSKGSLWEQSGIQAGDTILSVNGKPFSGPDQIAEALDKGGAVLNVQRNSREQSVMVNCP